MNDPPSMLDSHGPEAAHIAGAWWLMFALAAAVYAIVAGLVVVAILRGRRRVAQPDARIENRWIVVGGIAVPVVILAVLAVVTVATTSRVRAAERDPVKITVIGKRWWWDVTYPAGDVRTANEIHVPVDRPVDIELRSDNVIHSFWVPQLAGKVDLIPGQVNHLRMKASDAGTYRGMCAEYCGLQHARMQFVVVAEAPAAFERWMTRNRSLDPTPADEMAARGQRVFLREACAGCHTIGGTTANGLEGPDLTSFGGRRSIAAVTVDNTPENLRRWITDPQSIKPGALMPPATMSADDVNAVVAYLESRK